MDRLPDTTKAREIVSEYCRRYGISPSFEMSDIYHLTAENWLNPIPFTNNAGCYFFYAEDGALLYVGKASDLAGRVTSYFESAPSFRPRHQGWSMPPRYLQTVKVHDPHEAPSLEEYLIQKLQPPDNKLGKSREGEAG
jgi:excinuclease UvrABC nuclease subunit